jgi:hypothetical protein
MNAGLRELLGLPETNSTATIDGEFRQKFRDSMAGLNGDLQTMAAQGDPAVYDRLASRRETLYAAYQTAAPLNDPASHQKVIAAVAKTSETASSQKATAIAGREEWLKREAEFDAAVIKIAELEDAGHPKAAAYRKLTEAVRFQANERNYPDAIAALDQLQPKLAGLVTEHLQLANTTDSTAPGGPSVSQPPFKGAHEVEIVNKTVTTKTKYGELKLVATIKVMPTIGSDGGSSPVGSTTTGTSKIKDDGRQGGVKQTFGYQDIKNLKILDSIDISDITIGVEGEWSGTEIMASGIFKGKIKTSFFSSPVSVKLILFTVKEGESPKAPGVEVKIAPTQFTVKTPGVETPLFVEYKATFVLDRKAALKKVVEELAEKKLQEEAKKQGVKMLARKAGEKVLTRLGPVATAFGVGWDIGTLLNRYTISGDTARVVIETIIGDFPERWQNADTVLGKMFLVSRYSPQIIAALVAGGVTGVAAGVGDIVLFKIMGLDQLGPAYNQALAVFQDLVKVVPNIGQGIADTIIDNAIKLGIKLNPKYRTIADPAVNRMALAVYAVLKPVYKKSGGLNDLLGMRLHDADIAEQDLRKFAELIHSKKLKFDGIDLNVPPQEVALQLLDFTIPGFVTFLETHRLIAYKINFGNDMSLDSLPEELVAEVFK